MAKLCALRGPWFDSAGNPLNGGKIYTYQTGSDTAKATYTDATADTPHPNPVILDSSGCKTLFLLTDTAYRFVVKTSGGTTTETIDEITPVTTLSAGIGNSDVNITNYALVTDAGEDLHITPGAAGKLYLGSLQMPTAAPTTNQILTASDTTTLQWGNPATGLVQSDSNPTLVADLKADLFSIRFSDGVGIVDANSADELIFYKTASAVNHVSLTNAATGNGPTFAAVGTDSNVNININGKGTGGVVVNKLTSTGALVASSTLNVTGTTTLAGMVQGGTTFPTSPGSSNTILRSNGGGSSSWVSVGILGGALQYIETKTASSSSALTFTGLNSNYKSYLVICRNILPASGGAHLLLRTSTNGGSSYDSGASDYAFTSISWAAGAQFISSDNAETYLEMVRNLSGTAGHGWGGHFYIHNPSGSGNYTVVEGGGSGWNGSGNYATNSIGGARIAAADVDAIQLYMSTGNIASGTFLLYGII